MLSIWWGLKDVIYWELLPENRAQLNKLGAEVINNGLFSGKIYFQQNNAKPHIAKIVKEK